ncbi:Zn-dependent hydrolase [Bosea sp. (in: a-proteobacteria)]|uniref:Zn-dependent hydrolase n=1 Tax=Bosea sp. (in: a-proteobacteria) TaxID=1871050 RepID=UPI00263614A8|nr:Zn-dependent hydrolase [Bosea sp. (in: a-proteobacteria)]MCO5089966.1 Zn-dependent hydrolase [Bosea sp. (in: a-proteobacteria)]
MAIDQDRLWRRIETLSRITDPERPWTRRSFTPRFLEGRAWLAAEFRAAGLETEIDAAGNLIGRLAGADPALKPILIGSHSDTVPSGGRYDGILGVLAALEVAQDLVERGERPRHPLEVVDFLAEEPSEFGLSCIGSRALAGTLNAEHLALTRPDGMTLREGIAYVGGHPDELASVKRPADGIAAYVEVHIEQGRVLENERIPIGIVTDIAGIHRERITVTGRADHAGATPMPLRADALVGAAKLIQAAYERALASARGNQPLVATFGHIEVSPNAANAVPGEAVLTLEVRSGDEAATAAFGAALARDLRPALEALRLTIAVAPISHVAPTACAPLVRQTIARAAASLGLATRDLPSGAGHDGVQVARTGPVGMIFVPCLDGRSHAPEESITPEQAGDGARVLAETVRLLDAG